MDSDSLLQSIKFQNQHNNLKSTDGMIEISKIPFLNRMTPSVDWHGTVGYLILSLG